MVLNTAGGRRTLYQVGTDTTNVAVAGDTVADYVSLFGQRMAHVQLVDTTPAGHVVWGDGHLPLGQYVTELAEYGYAGKLTPQLFGNGSYVLDPVATWRRSLDAIGPYLDQETVAA